MFPDLFVHLGGLGRRVSKCLVVLERNAIQYFGLDGLDGGEVNARFLKLGNGLVLVLVLVLFLVVVFDLLSERVVEHISDFPAGHRLVVFLVGGRHLGEFGKQPDMFGVAVMRSDAGVFLADTHTFGALEKSRLTASFLHAFRGSGCKYTYLRCAVIEVGVVDDGCDGCVFSGH